VILTTHVNPASTLRMHGALAPLPHASSWRWCLTAVTTLPFREQGIVT
jgi:hypothetical protein